MIPILKSCSRKQLIQITKVNLISANDMNSGLNCTTLFQIVSKNSEKIEEEEAIHLLDPNTLWNHSPNISELSIKRNKMQALFHIQWIITSEVAYDP